MQKTIQRSGSHKSKLADVLLVLRRGSLLRGLGRSLAVASLVTIVTFALVRLVPGDPVLMLLGDLATEELIARYRDLLGLNGTLLQQFWSYFVNILHGNLGTSINTGQSVISIIQRTLPVTGWLLGVTMFLVLLLGIPLGVLAAAFRRTWFGHAFRIGTSILLALPSFYSGLVLILLFAITLGLAPVAGYVAGFPQNLHYLWLPALTLCCVLVPVFARVLQSSIVDTMEQEFVETAIVRGLPRPVLVWRYYLRPSLAPTISLVSYQLGQLLSSAVIVEIVFNLPGIGTELVLGGVLLRDYPVVQGIVLVFGLLVVVISYLTDVISSLLDPRIKIG